MKNAIDIPYKIKDELQYTHILVGVTGHRDLIKEDKGRLQEKVNEILDEITHRHPNKKIALISCFADGADYLVAEVALNHPNQNIEVYPLLYVDYEKFISEYDELYLKNSIKCNIESDRKNCKGCYFYCKMHSMIIENEFIKKPDIKENKKVKEPILCNYIADFFTLTVDKVDALESKMYSTPAKILASVSDYLIALWDGVDTGKSGGTSEVVQMALEGRGPTGEEIIPIRDCPKIFTAQEADQFKKENKNPRGILFHLVTPRTKNPFPLGRYSDFRIPFAPPPGTYHYSATPFPQHSVNRSNLFILKKYYYKNINYNTFLSRIIIPSVFFILTLILGYHGFKEHEKNLKDIELKDADLKIGDLHHPRENLEKWIAKYECCQWYTNIDSIAKNELNTKIIVNDSLVAKENIIEEDTNILERNTLFSALNLLTMNSAVLNGRIYKVPWKLTLARIFGGLFLVWGFLVLLWTFITDMTWHKWRVIRYKVWGFLGLIWAFIIRKEGIRWNIILGRGSVNFIFGINDMSLNLANDLNDKGKKVVMCSDKIDPLVKKELNKKGISVLIGLPHSITFLEDLSLQLAKDIYLMELDEEKSIRTLQEIDELFIKLRNRGRFFENKIDCYISLSARRNISLVADIDSISGFLKIHIYNVYENMSRRLLLQYPADRIGFKESNKKLQILIFGFTKLSKELILSLIRNTVFVNTKVEVMITVYTENANQAFDDFIKEYPVFSAWKDTANTTYSKPKIEVIRKELLPIGLLNFEELPTNKSELLHSGSLIKKITSADIVNAYYCFNETLQSVSLIQNFCDIAPNVIMNSEMSEVIKDVRIFCYYNLDDEHEIRQVEHRLNQKLPFIPIIFFGSFIEECKSWAIKSRFMDDLPKMFNFSYETNSLQNIEKLDKSEEKKMNESWDKLSYSHKESSRYAADHIWVKLRSINLEPFAILKQISEQLKTKVEIPEWEKELNFLAELEHNRWSVEKLIEGYVPLQDIEPGFTFVELVEKWKKKEVIDGKKDKYFKKIRQAKLLHIDLIPYKDLGDEQKKDIEQIKAIPRMIKILYEKNNLNMINSNTSF